MIPIGRILRPRSIAVFGGRFAEAVLRQCDRMGYAGEVWPVHPERVELLGRRCFRAAEDLPGAPDAAFLGINRHATIEAVQALSRLGAGGAVCYASGFREVGQDGSALQDELVAAAGAMPVLGPNCYGLINYLDGALLWPDVHGGERIERGVAIVTQSSNVGVNLTMSRRGVPLAYLITAGNQAVVGLHDIVHSLAEDDRLTAIGIYIEGIADADAFSRAVETARRRGKPVVVLKTGRTDAARAMALSHTASLSGSDAVMDEYFRRLAVARVESVPQLLETLKILHAGGPLSGRRLVSLSCSGGEASIMSDAARHRDVEFPPFTDADRDRIRDTVNPLVHVSNPFDYHTFDWGDALRLEATFKAVMRSGFDLAVLVMDFPRERAGDARDWDATWGALASAAADTQCRAAVLATLPECLPEARCEQLLAAGLIPLHGVDDALAAAEAAAFIGGARAVPVLPKVPVAGEPRALDEIDAKALLAGFGVPVPEGRACPTPEEAVGLWHNAGSPIAMKAVSRSLVHKTDAGGVALGIDSEDAIFAAWERLSGIGDRVLAEVMVRDGIAEFIVGASRDPVVGLHLVVGMGGVMAEAFRSSRVLLMPTSREEIRRAIGALRFAPVLEGWRGRPPADVEAVVDIVLKVQDFAVAHRDTLLELDINPVIARASGAVAVDSTIWLTREEH